MAALGYIPRVPSYASAFAPLIVFIAGACASQPAGPAVPVPTEGQQRENLAEGREERIEVTETCRRRVTKLGALGRGRLARSAIRETLKRAQPRFDDCLSKANARGARLHGVVAFAFIVGGDGRVVSAWADEEASTVTDAGFTCCMVRVVEGVVFPEPVGGSVVGRYSLNLRNDALAARGGAGPSGT